MRSSNITATLLSVGTLSIAGAAHAAPLEKVVLDTGVGTTTTEQTTFVSHPQDLTTGTINWGKVPDAGLGVAIHADATMTITEIEVRFRATDGQTSLNSGPGRFAITDLATQTPIWSVARDWVSDPTGGNIVRLDHGIELERGKDYVIAYCAFSPTLPLFNTYVSIMPTGPVSGLVEPIGFGKVSLDGALSNAAAMPAYKLDAPLSATSAFPPLKLTARIGDTDRDMILDDVDNCIDDANQSQADFDFDGVGDACDNCKAVYNPDQSACSGGGGGGGGTNPDRDGDGVFDVRDNCPFDVNAGQLDADHDRVGDACDGTDNTAGCSAGAASPSLLLAFAALLIRRRRR